MASPCVQKGAIAGSGRGSAEHLYCRDSHGRSRRAGVGDHRSRDSVGKAYTLGGSIPWFASDEPPFPLDDPIDEHGGVHPGHESVGRPVSRPSTSGAKGIEPSPRLLGLLESTLDYQRDSLGRVDGSCLRRRLSSCTRSRASSRKSALAHATQPSVRGRNRRRPGICLVRSRGSSGRPRDRGASDGRSADAKRSPRRARHDARGPIERFKFPSTNHAQSRGARGTGSEVSGSAIGRALDVPLACELVHGPMAARAESRNRTASRRHLSNPRRIPRRQGLQHRRLRGEHLLLQRLVRPRPRIRSLRGLLRQERRRFHQ